MSRSVTRTGVPSSARVVDPGVYRDALASGAIKSSALVVSFDDVADGLHDLLCDYKSATGVVYVCGVTPDVLREVLGEDMHLPGEEDSVALSVSSGHAFVYPKGLPSGLLRVQWEPAPGESSTGRNALKGRVSNYGIIPIPLDNESDPDNKPTAPALRVDNVAISGSYTGCIEDERLDMGDYSHLVLPASSMDIHDVYENKNGDEYTVMLCSDSMGSGDYSLKSVRKRAKIKARSGEFPGDAYSYGNEGKVVYDSRPRVVGNAGLHKVSSTKGVGVGEDRLCELINGIGALPTGENPFFKQDMFITTRFCMMGLTTTYFGRGDIVHGFKVNPDLVCTVAREDGRKLSIEVDGSTHNRGDNPLNDYFRDQALHRVGWDVIRVKTSDGGGIRGYRTIVLEGDGTELCEGDRPLRELREAICDWFAGEPSEVSYTQPALEVNNKGFDAISSEFYVKPGRKKQSEPEPSDDGWDDDWEDDAAPAHPRSRAARLRQINSEGLPVDAVVLSPGKDNVVHISGEGSYELSDGDMQLVYDVLGVVLRGKTPDADMPYWMRECVSGGATRGAGQTNVTGRETKKVRSVSMTSRGV